MCRHITKDERLEGWRATAELLAAFRPRLDGVKVAAVLAWLHRGILAAGHAFANPAGARCDETDP